MTSSHFLSASFIESYMRCVTVRGTLINHRDMLSRFLDNAKSAQTALTLALRTLETQFFTICQEINYSSWLRSLAQLSRTTASLPCYIQIVSIGTQEHLLKNISYTAQRKPKSYFRRLHCLLISQVGTQHKYPTRPCLFSLLLHVCLTTTGRTGSRSRKQRLKCSKGDSSRRSSVKADLGELFLQRFSYKREYD